MCGRMGPQYGQARPQGANLRLEVAAMRPELAAGQWENCALGPEVAEGQWEGQKAVGEGCGECIERVKGIPATRKPQAGNLFSN